MLHARPAGGVANRRRVAQVVLEAHRHGIGCGIIVVGVGAVEVAGGDLAGVIQRRGAGSRGGIARQTDGGNAAVGRVVLGYVQIVKIQAVFGAEAKCGRWRDAVTLVFHLVPARIMGFLAHQIQTHRAGFANGLVNIQGAASEPGAARAGGGVDAGIEARLFADHID